MSANIAILSIVFFSCFRFALTEDGERCGLQEERKVNECLQPMLDYAAKLQADTGAMQFPLQGGEVFKKLCSIYSEFKTCVSELTCDSLSVDAVDASYGYMCGAGQPLFEQHAACFARVEFEKSYVSCKTAATQAITEAQETKVKVVLYHDAQGEDYQSAWLYVSKLQSGSTEAYLAEMCRAMDGYLRCSHPIILEKCGAEAWKLVSTVTRDSLGVTMPDCDMRSALI